MHSEVTVADSATIADVQATIFALLPAMDVRKATADNQFNIAWGRMMDDLSADLLAALKDLGVWLVTHPTATVGQALTHITATFPNSNINWTTFFSGEAVRQLGMPWNAARDYLIANYASFGG
jgi:hypothetical protein